MRKKKLLKQLTLFDHVTMQAMKVPKNRGKKTSIIDGDIIVLAMRGAMECGNYDGPETADELCNILGLL